MGMTIDEAVRSIAELDKAYRTFSDTEYLALDTAMNTMQKYQKIKEIYERFQKDGSYYHHMAWLDVMEVIEDGNNNQHN